MKGSSEANKNWFQSASENFWDGSKRVSGLTYPAFKVRPGFAGERRACTSTVQPHAAKRDALFESGARVVGDLPVKRKVNADEILL